MNPADDPFFASPHQALSRELARGPHSDEMPQPPRCSPALPAASIGRLCGFDLLERPLVSHLQACPGEVVAARSAVALRKAMVGSEVVVVFEGADADRPIVLGVLEPHPLQDDGSPRPGLHIAVDGERHAITAEREIVLRCGDASITLTRAGKVIIRGSYIMSRSSGCNKIKGAAVDIN